MKANSRGVLRGTGAVLLGFVACTALSMATDAICHAIGFLPDDGKGVADVRYGVPLAYRILYGTAATALVALVAPAPRWRWVWVTGAIGLLLCLAGLLATIGKGPEFGPLWYSLALAASVPVTTFVGGWIVLRRRRDDRAAASSALEGTT